MLKTESLHDNHISQSINQSKISVITSNLLIARLLKSPKKINQKIIKSFGK